MIWYWAVGVAAATGMLLLVFPAFRKRVPYGWIVRPLVMTLLGRNACSSVSEALRGYKISLLHSQTMARLQSACRLLSGDARFEQWTTPDGDYWVPTGSGVKHLCNILSEQRLHTYGQDNEGVRRSDVVIDCGANVGVFTRAAVRLGAKLVVAVEPSPDNLECLYRNLEKEIAAGKVVVCDAGLWNEPSRRQIRVALQSCGEDTFVGAPDNSVGGPEIPMTTVDAIVSQYGLAQVDFMKMDIEGSEVNALAGAVRTLANYKPRVVVEVDHTDDPLGNIRNVTGIMRRADSGYNAHSHLWAVIKRGRVYPAVLFFTAEQDGKGRLRAGKAPSAAADAVGTH